MPPSAQRSSDVVFPKGDVKARTGGTVDRDYGTDGVDQLRHRPPAQILGDRRLPCLDRDRPLERRVVRCPASPIPPAPRRDRGPGSGRPSGHPWEYDELYARRYTCDLRVARGTFETSRRTGAETPSPSRTGARCQRITPWLFNVTIAFRQGLGLGTMAAWRSVSCNNL